MMDRNISKVEKFNVKRRLVVNQKVDIRAIISGVKKEYSSQIVDLIDEDTFIVNAPFSEGVPVNIHKGNNLDIIIRESKGIYNLPVKLLRREKEKTPLWVIEINGKVKKVQERQFFRLDIYQEVDFFKLDSCDISLHSETNSSFKSRNKGKEKHNAIIKDISATGLQMFLQEKLLKDSDFIEIDFSFTDTDVSKVLGKVVRDKEVFNKGQKRYSIGIEFVHSSERDKEKLMQWIFAKQRELRKKGLI